MGLGDGINRNYIEYMLSVYLNLVALQNFLSLSVIVNVAPFQLQKVPLEVVLILSNFFC